VPRYAFPSDAIEIRGAVTITPTDAGVTPRRVPAWAEREVPDELMRFDVGAAAGVRLAFETEATSIRLEAVFTRIEVAWTSLVPTAIDLVVDGGRVESVPITIGPIFRLEQDLTSAIRPGDRADIRFATLPSAPKRVEIWLPHAAQVELLLLETDADVAPPAPETRPLWVHHGSSISHSMETLWPTTTWPAVAARRLGVAGTNLGFAGEAMLDPFVARTIRDLPADLISLKLGVNVVPTQTLSPRAFRTAAHGFIDTIREKHPHTPLVLVSAIYCPIHETGAEVWPLTIAGSRAILAEVVEARADDPNLHYLDGRRLLDEDEADLLPDDLHPNTEGYRRMGERFAEFAASLL
jgi:lysophospholipase L1-like esterase